MRCDSEVENCRAALSVDQNVRGLEIAMDDTLRMRGAKAVGDLRGNSNHPLDRQAAAFDQRRHRAADDQLHRDVRLAVDLPRFENRADIRMPERGGGTCLAKHPVGLGDVAGFGLEHLDRDVALQLGVERQVNLAHTAGAKPSLDAIPTERRVLAQHAACILART